MSEQTSASRQASRKRLTEGATLGVGVILALALYLMVNYLGERHYLRFDWTSSQLYSLSEKSLSVVRGLDRDVDVVLFLSPASELYPAVDELASRYAAANPARIEKRVVDPARNMLEAQRLVEQYGIERQNVVVVATDDDRRVIGESELAEYDFSGAQFGQGPTLESFRGEQQITSAILALVEAEKPKILLTTGHGEGQLAPGTPRSLSRMRDLLGKDNFEIEEWGSLGKSEVPADADLVVVAGPTTGFLPPELELFSSYLESGGRMLFLLDPAFAPDGDRLVSLGLADWLRGYGVEVRGDVVIDPASELPFFGPETIFTSSYGSHPIVESLGQTRAQVLFPLARSVTRADDAPGELEVTDLVETSSEAWGETDLENLEQMGPDEDDLRGPISLGVAVTLPAAATDEPGDNGTGDEEADDGTAADETPEGSEAEPGDQGRLVVYGDFDFAADGQLDSAANSILLANTFNWLVKREQLIEIAPREPEQTKLTLSRSELSNVYIIVLLLMPGSAVVLGVWVYMQRRR
jgi:hypothetical protein